MTNKNDNFCSLHSHCSQGSMLDAMTNIDDMFKRAAELGQTSLALTDHGTCAAIFDAHKASKKYGINYIPGIEAYFVDDVNDPKQKRRHIVLLAKNEKGFRNLLSLNYKGYLNLQYVAVMNKVFPKIDWNLLEEHKEGIICLTACGSGLISRQMFIHNEDGVWLKDECDCKALETAQRLKDIFGEDLYLEVQPHNLKVYKTKRKTGEVELNKDGEPIIVVDQNHINKMLQQIGKRLDIKLVATTDVHYLDKEDAKIHDMLMAINSKAPLSDKNRHRYEVEEFYMKDRATVFNHFAETFDEDFARIVCDNTMEIANKCEQSAEYLSNSEVRFPQFDIEVEEDYSEFIEWLDKQSFKDKIPKDHSMMRFRCQKVFHERCGKFDKAKKKIYFERLKKELKILEKHNFSSYMLIVSDFIRWAKQNDIMVGPGRGCLTKNTPVFTTQGFKPIQDVSIGDKVYTHTGQIKGVSDTFVYDVNEELITLKTDFSFGNLTFTRDHKVYAEKRKYNSTYLHRKSNSYISANKTKKFMKPTFNPEWMPVSDLSKGDLLFMPTINRNIINPQNIDLADFLTNEDYNVGPDYIEVYIPQNNEISIRKVASATGLSRSAVQNAKHTDTSLTNTIKIISRYLDKYNIGFADWQNNNNKFGKKISRFIPADDDLFYFLGRWAGDGWYKINNQTNYVGIAFHSDDHQGIQRISSYLEGLGFECKYNKSKKKNLIQMYVYGKMLPNLIRSLFTDYQNKSYTKHLPYMFRTLSNKYLKSMLSGLIDSDGNRGPDRISIDTTSPILANQVKEALMYLGIPAGIVTRNAHKRGKYECKKSYKIRFNNNYKRSEMVSDSGYYCRILDIEATNDSKVYDIQVEDDHSYLTTNYAVHNSVGGSLVGYLLDIHAVDPIQYGLIFERFHNAEKTSFPDIDTDFSPDGRDRVKEYVVQKYGKEKVAHVSNLSKMTPKVVIKDIARSLELGGDKASAFKIANKITDGVPDNANTFDEALSNSKELRDAVAKYPELEKYGRKLVGLERAYATHAAGVVISDIDLSTYVPLRIDKAGNVSVQYEKNRVEAMGLIKMDFLGLENLRIVENTIKNARELGLECPKVEDVPLDDKAVWADISKGNTICVFQMGSPHMQAICKQVKPKSIEDLSIINALGRPSAGEIDKETGQTPRDMYVARRFGRQKVQYKYPVLKGALEDTLGICVYEEQLAKLAGCVAGWDLNKADGLRKLTKLKEKGKELAAKLQEDFINDGAAFCGLSKTEVADIWTNIIEPFAKYGFNKAHGIFYSLNGYYTAYYKHHYPACFMAAVLRSEVSKSSSNTRDANIKKYKKEAKRLGLVIKAPSINHSGSSFTVLNRKTLVIGLEAIKGVGVSAVNNIMETRAEHKFKSFPDFLYRTNSRLIRKDVIQSLARAGCFDDIGITRKSAFDYYQDIRVKANKHATANFKAGMDAWNCLDDFTFSKADIDLSLEWDKKTILEAEAATLGEYISGDINDLYEGFFTGENIVPLAKLKLLPNGYTIRTEAIVSDVAKNKLKRGRNAGRVYGKCMISDVDKTNAAITIWPEQWAKLESIFTAGRPIRAVCKVNEYQGMHSLVLEKLEKWR